MTTVSAEASLASVGDGAFDGCAALASISVSSSNAVFSSAGGVLYDKTAATLLRAPEGLPGSLSLSPTVTALGQGAFAGCRVLTEVVLPSGLTAIPADGFYYATGITKVEIPSSVTALGEWSFAGCSGVIGVKIPASVSVVGNDAFHHAVNLEWALFSGSAPAMGTAVFDHTASGFTVYYLDGSNGFSPTRWNGYASAPVTVSAEIADWLVSNEFSPVTDLADDSDGDGVSLLLAYALGLDPALNLASSMPVPSLSGGQLSINFTGNRKGVTYTVQTSTDLVEWTTSGVSLADPDSSGLRTASITLGTGESARFLRLVVEEQ